MQKFVYYVFILGYLVALLVTDYNTEKIAFAILVAGAFVALEIKELGEKK
jgi:hypothetical protein